ncbi:MAG: lipocalin-like domain-containing protein [Bacteroides sp.]|nr:lipocalin-like domain-containing protein [Roseburia sp.]MCM1345484.1 lipocalin-like domain-containing protein [Bacteroides sp.]MCM1419993.1 lipocalin-like domain-containing protein [Bacteroides sp.]
MRRTLKYMLSILAAITGLTSCEIETSGNGKLDGYWKLCSVDTVTTGNSTDLTDRSVFWAIQANMLSAQDNGKSLSTKYMFRFKQTTDSLVLYSPQLYDKAEGNKEIIDTELIKHVGINQLTSFFHIDKLSGKHMDLSDERLRLHFIKF